MSREPRNSDWLCIECGEKLGDAYGGEFYPGVPCENIHTSGPNLSVKCPVCGKIKIWYTADILTRATQQLVAAVADAAARAMTRKMAEYVREYEESIKRSTKID